MPETDSCRLIWYASEKNKYPLNKLLKIFKCFGFEFILTDNDSNDTKLKLSEEVKICK